MIQDTLGKENYYLVMQFSDERLKYESFSREFEIGYCSYLYQSYHIRMNTDMIVR